VAAQTPFAVILGCSDSRVPPEIVFDQGPGDLFVIRVAGNIVSPEVLGSVEFAVTQLGAPLVVVLGHSDCGAVGVAREALQGNPDGLSPGLRAIVDAVGSSIEELLKTDLADDPDALMAHAVRANIGASVHRLRDESPVLGPLVRGDRLAVVGAEYALDTGAVEFLD